MKTMICQTVVVCNKKIASALINKQNNMQTKEQQELPYIWIFFLVCHLYF